MKVVQRTFEARKHPLGSEKRAQLNAKVATSEYMPSHKYLLVKDDGIETPFSFGTKREAEARCFIELK